MTNGQGAVFVVLASRGGGYATNFSHISGPIAVPGTGAATNDIDVGGVTDAASRYHRIRLGPQRGPSTLMGRGAVVRRLRQIHVSARRKNCDLTLMKTSLQARFVR